MFSGIFFPSLHVIAQNEDSKYVSYCGLWYDEAIDYTYVISDMEFYKRLGFKQHSHYTFYWYRK